MEKNNWLAERKKGICGTDITAIMGMNPYVTPLQVFLDKTNQREPIEENLYMKIGTALEPLVAEMFGKETGYKVINPEEMIYIKDEIFRGTPDRFYEHGTRNILECKTTKKYIDNPETHHILQAEWYAGILMIPFAVAYIDGSHSFKHWEFEPDKTLIKLMQDRATEFWENHVLTGIPPEAMTLHDTKLLYPFSTEKQIETVYNSVLACQEYREIGTQIKELEEKQNAVRLQLEKAIGDAEALLYDGKPILTYKSCLTNRLDITALKAALPDIYKDYTKQISSRKFLVKGK